MQRYPGFNPVKRTEFARRSTSRSLVLWSAPPGLSWLTTGSVKEITQKLSILS